jgi:hypothetical protein
VIGSSETCIPCARPDMACETHGKPVGLSKASGPGFCGVCLAVMPCPAHGGKTCDHAWTPINLSPGFDSQCTKCGMKADFGT